MKWPGKENIDLAPEGGNVVPPPDRYTVLLTGTKVRTTASGAWLTFLLKIDEGPHKGVTLEDEFWISDSGDKMGMTYARLGNICEAAQWWPDIDPEEDVEPEAFALLWPADKLRWTVDCEHEFTIKAWVNVNSYKDYTKTSVEESAECKYDKWLTVDEAAFSEWKEKGGRTWQKLVPKRAFGVELQLVYGAAGERVEEEPMEMIESDSLPF
jgi:hypothetical protein